ncbi:zinc finger, CCHC-type containing protein [Tanacetum coccineum]
MDEAIQVSCIIDKLPPSWKDFKHTLKHQKQELTLVLLGSHLRIEESLKVQDIDKPKGNNVVGPSVVNMVEHNNSFRYNDNKGKRKHQDTKADPNKKSKVTCWKCEKPRQLKNDCKGGKVGNKANALGTNGSVNDSSNSLKAFMSTSKLNDSILWHARLGHVHFKRMQDMSKDRLIPAFDMDTEKCKTFMLTKITKKPFQNVKRETKVLELVYSDLCDLHATLSLENKKYFVTFIDDAYRFCYVYLLHTKEEALDKFKVFKTEVELQQGSLIKSFRTDRGGEYMDTLYFQSVGIIHETTAPYTPQQNGISERKKGTRDEVSDQHSYCFNVEDDLKIFDKAIKSQDVDGTIKKFKARLVIQGFRQKSGIDYFDTYAPVARISTIRLLIVMASIHNLTIHQMNVKTTFLNGELDKEVYMNQPQGFIMPGNENKVDLTKEFLSFKFSIKDVREADVIFVSTPTDTSEKLMPNNGQVVSQFEYSRVIGCLMYAMTCTRPDITFAVGKLSRINNAEDNSSTNNGVFLLGGGAISWASKKQTCITGSIMEYEFVALAAAGKEAEWLRNLILDIPLWSKPITPISIHCDSAATLAKAYSQMYNEKSRHLGVRHSMIRELITNEVVSIEFVRSQRNLADHLTKGLARDLVLKSVEAMGLKSNQVAEC